MANNILDLIEQAKDLLLKEAGEHGVKVARSSTNFKHSPAFNENITTFKQSSNQQVVWSKASYSSYLEFGNNQQGPYIYPRKAQALHFYMNGNEIFAKKVKSHGPLPYMVPSEKSIEDNAQAIWEDVKSKIFKE
jgi:hypothetical protein